MVNESSIWKFHSRTGYNTLTLQRSISVDTGSQIAAAKATRPTSSRLTTTGAPHRLDGAVEVERLAPVDHPALIPPPQDAALGFVRISTSFRFVRELAPIRLVGMRTAQVRSDLATLRFV
jgi:hypothetical protein